MTDQDYVYGVFSNNDNIQTVVSQLHKAGLQTSEICVLGNKSEQFSQLAGQIEDPTSKHFIAFGIGGAIAGLIAGLVVSLHIPGVNGFQLIVPLMGTVAGGACFPYFVCQLGTFLTSNRPQHWANVFEGTVTDGSVIVMAEPQSASERQAAMDIFLQYNPLEVIFRRAAWGVPLNSDTRFTDLVESAPVSIEPQFEQDKEDRRLTAVA